MTRIPLISSLCLIAMAASSALSASWSVALEPCTLAGAEARCGALEVPENPEARDGRKLSLRIAILPATDAPARKPDPLLILEGGPGASVLVAAPMHVSTFARVRQQRDLVFIEQRGTGESAALDCGLGTDGLMDPQRVRACRERMSQQADLHYYTTSQTIADLILALDQLGYRQVNVFGVSYGTRTALELVRRHPQRVRSVALLGTYPPGRNGVLDAPMILDRSLGLLVAACVADDSCRQAYPELESSVARLSQLLESADAQAMPATRLEVASALRLLLFYPLTARQVPKILSAAANGDLSPLQAMTATAGSAFGGITDGAFLSLLCSEDIARIEPDQAEQVAAGTLLRGEWGKALISVCKEWTAAPLAEDFHSPLQTIVPILSLTGELDPSMPPSWGEEFAAEQPNARHLTIPEGQHGLLGMRGVLCVVELIESLIDRGNTEDLDATCLEQVQRPPFALP